MKEFKKKERNTESINKETKKTMRETQKETYRKKEKGACK